MTTSLSDLKDIRDIAPGTLLYRVEQPGLVLVDRSFYLVMERARSHRFSANGNDDHWQASLRIINMKGMILDRFVGPHATSEQQSFHFLTDQFMHGNLACIIPEGL